MEDLKSPKFQGSEYSIDHLISPVSNDEFLILGNLLISDFVGAKLIPIIEKEGIAEVIQHYIKSRCECNYIDC